MLVHTKHVSGSLAWYAPQAGGGVYLSPILFVFVASYAIFQSYAICQGVFQQERDKLWADVAMAIHAPMTGRCHGGRLGLLMLMVFDRHRIGQPRRRYGLAWYTQGLDRQDSGFTVLASGSLVPRVQVTEGLESGVHLLLPLLQVDWYQSGGR